MVGRTIVGDAVVVIECVCPQCGSSEFVPIDRAGFEDYEGGTHINDAMPWLPARDRRMVVCGMCDFCWDYLMSTQEER